MCNLVFKCPQCGNDITSGIDVDDTTLHRLSRHPLGLTCPTCDATTAFPLRLGRRQDADQLALAQERDSLLRQRPQAFSWNEVEDLGTKSEIFDLPCDEARLRYQTKE